MKKLKSGHSNFVTGEKFWDREKDLESFIQKLEEGANIQLVAQRRIGKTSLMREAGRRMQDRYICLQVDLQGCSSAAEAVVEISMATYPHSELWGKTKHLFRRAIDKAKSEVESFGPEEFRLKFKAGLLGPEWRERGDSLLQNLAKSGRPVVIFIDEITILVNRLLKGDDFTITPERRRNTDEFMHWIRENCIRHQGKIRFVLTGSIGLEPVLRQAGLSGSINAFTTFDLPPWSKKTALGCLEALGNEYGISYEDGARDLMVEKIGCCIPHHVQMFFSHVQDHLRHLEKTCCTPAVVETVFKERMLSTRGHAELTHYEERLRLELGSVLQPVAIELLTETAVTGNLNITRARKIIAGFDLQGLNPAQTLRELMEVLEYDGYLSKKGNAFVFTSCLLRDWWKARHEIYYKPIMRRG